MTDDTRLRAGEILAEYVTFGSMDADDQFDAHFDKLAELAPQRTSAPTSILRVVSLPGESVEATRAGSPLTLRPRRYGSWTKSPAAIAPLLRGRFARLAEDQVLVVMRKELPAGTWALDVEQAYLDLHWDHPDVTEWGQYVAWEREIITEQSPGLLTLTAEDIVSVHGPDDTRLLAPVPGETCWTEGFESRPEIASIPDSQPEADDGIYQVEIDGGMQRVRWNATEHCWEPPENPDLVHTPFTG